MAKSEVATSVSICDQDQGPEREENRGSGSGGGEGSGENGAECGNQEGVVIRRREKKRGEK
jgi:hypothetical protein